MNHIEKSKIGKDVIFQDKNHYVIVAEDNGKSMVLFFTSTSLRTRVTFERGIYLLGGQSIPDPRGREGVFLYEGFDEFRQITTS